MQGGPTCRGEICSALHTLSRAVWNITLPEIVLLGFFWNCGRGVGRGGRGREGGMGEGGGRVSGGEVGRNMKML